MGRTAPMQPMGQQPPMQMQPMQMQPMQLQGPPMAQPPRTSHTAVILASAIAFVGVAAVALVAVLALGGDESGGNGPVLTAATESQAAQVPAAVPTTPVASPAAPPDRPTSPPATRDPSKQVPVPAPVGPQPGDMNQDGTMYGEIMSHSTLNIRSGPSTGYSKVMALRQGTAVTISCWTRGDMINPGGGRTATDVWDYLVYPAEGWVADAYVNTGTTSPAFNLPSCY